MKTRLHVFWTLAAVLSLGLSLAGVAQTVTITGGTLTSALSPINHANPDGIYECIYLRSQINQAGAITRLAFEKLDGADLTPLTGVTIYLKSTPLSAFPAGTSAIDSSGYERVFKGGFPNASEAGYQEIVLSQPFLYDNLTNLSVLVIRRGGTNLISLIGRRARYAYGNVTGRNTSRRYTGSGPITSTTPLTASVILVNLRLQFGTVTANQLAATADQRLLYPNPATTHCVVSLPVATRPAQAHITDLLGRLVQPTQPLRAAPNGTAQVAVAQLPAGTYLLHVVQDDQTEVQRFVKK